MRVFTAASGFAALMLLGACGGPPATQPGGGPPSVSVAQPVTVDLTLWDEYTGRLAAVERVEIRARVSGYLDQVLFDEGSLIEAGETLFIIDQRPFAAALDQAKAGLTAAQVRLDLAGNDLDRAERLFASRAISEEELDARRQEVRAAAAAVEASQAQVRQATLDLQFTEIKAPISGRVDRARVTIGNLVSGGTAGSTHLTTMVSMDPMYALFTADEQDYLRYTRLDRAGRRPSSRDTANPMRLKLPDESGFSREGYIDFVSAEVSQSTGTIEGRAVFDNADGVLVPGLFVRLQLLGESRDGAVLIPDSAILADQSERFVFVVDDGRALRRPVVPGRRLASFRLIESGLSGGESVIVSGVQRARDGEPVAAQATTIDLPDDLGNADVVGGIE